MKTVEVNSKNIDEAYARYCVSPNLYDCESYDPELVKLTETLKSMAMEENSSYVRYDYYGVPHEKTKNNYIRQFVRDYVEKHPNGKDNIVMVMASGKLEEAHDTIDKCVFSDRGWNIKHFNDPRGWVSWPFKDNTNFVGKEDKAITYYYFNENSYDKLKGKTQSEIDEARKKIKKENKQLEIANTKKVCKNLLDRIMYNREACFTEMRSHHNGVPVIAVYDLAECAEVVEKEGKIYIKMIKDDKVRIGGKNWIIHAGDGIEVKNYNKETRTFSWADSNYKRGLFRREVKGRSSEYFMVLDKVLNNNYLSPLEQDEKIKQMDEIIQKNAMDCYLGDRLLDEKTICEDIINEFCQEHDILFDFKDKIDNNDKKIIYDEVKNELHTLYNYAYEEINAGRNIDDYSYSVCFNLAMNNDYTNTPELDDKIFNQVVKNILNSYSPAFEQIIRRFDENNLIDHPEDLEKWNKLVPKIQEEIKGYGTYHEQYHDR